MYNKIFTKILDSSIWLESDTTRLVWLTFLASMDQDGFAAFASVRNLAHRARVSEEACGAAVVCLESPDHDSSDPDQEGRRIERVPGGWLVINAEKYRDIVTRAVSRERTRERVKRWREKHASNGQVTASNVPVTQSDTDAETETNARSEAKSEVQDPSVRASRSLTPRTPKEPSEAFMTFWARYPKRVGKQDAIRAWEKNAPPLEAVLSSLEWQCRQPDWLRDDGQFIPHAATYLNRHGWQDEPFNPAPYVKPLEVKPGRGAQNVAAMQRAIDQRQRARLLGDGRDS